MKNEIALITGMTKNRVIGKDNELPWHIPEDLQNFKNITQGHSVIMGKNTYDSIGKPLPNRYNIILNKKTIKIKGVDVCTSIPDAIEKAKSYKKKIFFIGGANVYAQALEFVDTMYISHIKDEYEGNVYFPEFQKNKWNRIQEKDFNKFTFVIYKRKL